MKRNVGGYSPFFLVWQIDNVTSFGLEKQFRTRVVTVNTAQASHE
jgi:hypothetical protein